MPDAIISDVTVVLDARYGDDTTTRRAVEALVRHGMEVRHVDFSNSTVEGTIPQAKVHELQQLDCVDYVRTAFTYHANYPAGDPRDLDAPRP